MGTSTLKDIAPILDSEKVRDRRPDFALYEPTKAARDAYMASPDSDPAVIPAERIKHRASTAWAWMTMTVDVDHPWGHYTPSDYEYCEESRMRMSCSYHHVSQIFLHQHRLHVFSVYIDGGSARLARWDRGGVILTQPIDMRHPEHLLDFMHRLGRLSREQLGYDTTAELAKKPDIAKLLRYTTTNEYLKRHHESIVQNMVEWPVYKVILVWWWYQKFY